MGTRNYTVSNLRAFVKSANDAFPLPEPNGYGNHDRFVVSCAYGGYEVHMLEPGSTGHRQVTYGYVSAREAANMFYPYLARFRN